MADDQGDKELRALCKLFIGGIPRSITDEQLAEAFLKYTDDETLNDCVVIKDEMKNSRGFGFVTYNKLSDTDNCLANRPHILGGKEVEVKHAIPRDEQNPTNHSRTNKIFLGGFPHEATEADTSEAIENYTLAVGESLNVKVEKVDIIKKNDNQPRGFCFVEMASEDDADKVVIVKYFVINGKRVELKKAEPKGAKGGMGGGMGGRGGRGGRDSNRGGGGGGGRMSSFGGGGGSWGGNMGGGGYGGGYDQYSGGGYSDYGLTGYGTYGTAGFGGGYDYSLGQYPQSTSSFGPSRTSNGRYGGGGGARGGRGGGGSGGSGNYRPY